MKYIKLLGVVMCLCILTTAFAGCSKDKDIKIAESEYLAQGSIPASAKIYPIVDDTLPMLVAYKDEQAQQFTLSEDDVKEITTKIDKFCAACANSGAEDYDDTPLDFITEYGMADIARTIEERGMQGVMDGCQIVTLTGLGKNKAEALVLLTGTLSRDQKQRVNLFYVGLQKTEGVWYIIGNQTALAGLAEDYKIYRDNSTGKIIIDEIQKGSE